MSNASKETFARDLRASRGEEPFTDSKNPLSGCILHLRFGEGSDTWIVTINYRLVTGIDNPLITYGVSVRNPKDPYIRDYGKAVAWSRRVTADTQLAAFGGSCPSSFCRRPAYWNAFRVGEGVVDISRRSLDLEVITKVTHHLFQGGNDVPMKLQSAVKAFMLTYINKTLKETA